ncbi:hotdog fold thioesterase [Sulfobacillus harzensis]|uniref:Hotdog fold thioesterase n=1 Tax=Sulfobacillus harzensis TaxID=2729629 RepID=A0A7Y0L3K2_9FIRM|nr:hotdog fold thioesterase [Sulfobacillus harzensis]NMP21765.1 hotdog fold thioesterase [Sulfobacillus harzensis]
MSIDSQSTLLTSLGIEIQSAEPDLVVATMPVDHRTRQPFGILHGGASVALAETVASIGTAIQIDQSRQMAVGLEINANHIRAKADGMVTARAVPVHRGRTTMVWDIRITDEEDKLVAISRCTVMIRDRTTTRS